MTKRNRSCRFFSHEEKNDRVIEEERPGSLPLGGGYLPRAYLLLCNTSAQFCAQS